MKCKSIWNHILMLPPVPVHISRTHGSPFVPRLSYNFLLQELKNKLVLLEWRVLLSYKEKYELQEKDTLRQIKHLLVLGSYLHLKGKKEQPHNPKGILQTKRETPNTISVLMWINQHGSGHFFICKRGSICALKLKFNWEKLFLAFRNSSIKYRWRRALFSLSGPCRS